MKRELQSRGHQFSSETDTEVIAHLVEEGLSQGLCFEDAFRRTGGIVQGSQAIAATCEGDEKLCVLRLGHAGGIVVAQRIFPRVPSAWVTPAGPPTANPP